LGKLSISLTHDVEEKIRKLAKEQYGDKRGSLSIFIEKILREFLESMENE